MQTAIMNLTQIAALALQRHDAASRRQPRRAAASYLRVAIRCARQLATVGKPTSEQFTAALELLEQIASVAQAAEAALFARGGASGPYLTVLAAISAAHIDILTRQQRQAGQHASAAARHASASHAEPTPQAPAEAAPTPVAAERPVAAQPPADPPVLSRHPTKQPHPAEKPQSAAPTSHPPHYRKASGARLAS